MTIVFVLYVGGNDDENRFVENYTVEISHGEIDNRNMNCFCYHMLICLWKLLGFNSKYIHTMQ